MKLKGQTSLAERLKNLEYNPFIEMPRKHCYGVPVKFSQLPKDNKIIFNLITGVNLHLFREAKGITEEQLEEKAGLEKGAVRKIENFERELSAYELFKVAKVLDVSIDDLTSLRLDHSVKKLSPFELVVCPYLMKSFDIFVNKDLFDRHETATAVLKKAVSILYEFPELWKLIARLNKSNLKKVINSLK